MTVVQGDPRQHPRECDEYFQGLRCMIETVVTVLPSVNAEVL